VNLVLLGSPGAGKGTQAERLAERTGLVHIATGDIFRANARDGTELGRRAKAYMDRGELVPDEITIEMLLQRLEEPDTEGGVIFDGFPRNLRQAQALDEALAGQGKRVDRVAHIQISDDEAVNRLATRWLCRGCGRIYNFQPRAAEASRPCGNCGGELYQREDDRPEVVRARLAHQKPPAELLDYYRRQEKLETIDGERDLDAITDELFALAEPQVGNRA
jgi:adenylate kinase